MCEISNLASENRCRLCDAPARLSGSEFESLRATWEDSANTTASVGGDLGLPTRLALFLGTYLASVIGLIEISSSSGANLIGIGLVFVPLLIPVPLLAFAWIVAFIHSLLKEKEKSKHIQIL